MKSPVAPRPVPALLRENTGDLAAILAARQGETVSGRYVHWDNLRHRTPPPGLSHEQWWLAIKLSRQQQYRAIGLVDRSGDPFVYMLPDVVLEGLHFIDSHASGRLGAAQAITNESTRDRFIVSSLLEEAITSSQLEGASTTRRVAADMLRSGRRPIDRSERMIFNNYEAMHAVRALRGAPLRLAHVVDLHATLTVDTLDDPCASGRIQTPQEDRVSVVDNATGSVVHVPPPAAELPHRLERMLRFANGPGENDRFVHPVIRAILLHFWLAYEHPFEDGNGRTARALFYWSMLHSGYWLFEFVTLSRLLTQAPARYARAFLHTESDGNDLTYFIVHQIDVIKRSIGELEKYLEKKAEQVSRVERLLRRTTHLNHRQIALLAHAIRHPDPLYTIKSHQRSHGIAYATARSDLFDLASAGLLEKTRSGRKTYVFAGPEDLEKRLRTLR